MSIHYDIILFMGIFEWTIVDTPDSIPNQIREILNPMNLGAGIVKLAVSNDISPIWAIIRRGDRNGLGNGGAQLTLYMSSDIGRTWTDVPYLNLTSAQSGIENGTLIWNMAVAPDNPKILAVVCSNIQLDQINQEIWVSEDQGSHWKNTHWVPSGKSSTQLVSVLAISIDYGNRKIILGTRDGTGQNNSNLYITKLTGFGGWNVQNLKGNPPSKNEIFGDILDIKFSPNFNKDNTIVILYTNGTSEKEGTWLAIGTHDTSRNFTHFQDAESHMEIRNSNAAVGNSAKPREIITGNIELPSDFSGDSQDRRHVYINVDAIDRIKDISPNRGVYRIEKDNIYTLMDNTSTFGHLDLGYHPRRVSSIAYFGVCAVGKLLVGEVIGDAKTCTIPTWFTSSPTIDPIPYWFPALKPITGAGREQKGSSLPDIVNGYGNAIVAWSPAGEMAYGVSSAAALGPWAWPEMKNGAVMPSRQWPAGYMQISPFDESAFSMTRTNGLTWNQLSLINTQIKKLTDIAPSPNNATMYLASIGFTGGFGQSCSIWRSTINPNIAAPLTAQGEYWERVLLCVYHKDNKVNSFLPILRLINSCTDKRDGEIIATGLLNTRVIFWSPDYGDYWTTIPVTELIQDFCFESSTQLYVLSPGGMVQRTPYTGYSWSNKLPLMDTHLKNAHSIVATPDRNVLAGASKNAIGKSPVAYSNDYKPFVLLKKSCWNNNFGNVHIAFDPNFQSNGLIYINREPNTIRENKCSIHRNSVISPSKWISSGMFKIGKSGTSNFPHSGIKHYGIAIAKTGDPQPALYSAHDKVTTTGRTYNSGVCRTTKPRDDLVNPGIKWDCLDIYNPQNINDVCFSLEPSSLKLSGCCTLDTSTSLFAIDNNPYSGNHNLLLEGKDINKIERRGMLWSLIDNTAKTEMFRRSTVAIPDKPTVTPESKLTRKSEIDIIEERELKKVIIYTEGKLDESILMTAWKKLNPTVPCPYKIIKCDPNPNGSGGGAGGCTQLAKTLSVHHPVYGSTVIGIFDRETDGIKEFNNLKGNFTEWKGRDDVKVSSNRLAYAILLPIPSFRERCAQLKNLSIEFMFSNSVLRKLQHKGYVVNFNLRINEFAVPENLVSELKKHIPPDLYNDCRRFTDETKNMFAHEIVPNLAPSEFESFIPLFNLIKEITD